MTVSSQNPTNSYIGDGVALEAFYTFYIFDVSQLLVYVDGVLLTLNIDYTVSGVGAENGGTVTFVIAPGLDLLIKFQRALVVERDIDYIQGGQLNAETLDTDIDSVVLMIQDLSSVSPSISGGNEIDMNGARVINVGDPIDDQDATTKKWVVDTYGNAADDAQQSADEAAVSAAAALDSENKAEQWAQEAEDVEVDPGEYSAYHWAQKSAAEANIVTSVNGDIGDVIVTAASVGALSTQGGILQNTTTNATTLELHSIDTGVPATYKVQIQSVFDNVIYGEFFDIKFDGAGGRGLRMWPQGTNVFENGVTQIFHTTLGGADRLIFETHDYGIHCPAVDSLAYIAVGATPQHDYLLGNITSGAGLGLLYTDAYATGGLWQLTNEGGLVHPWVTCIVNGGVNLLYNNAIKVTTTSLGANITGGLQVLNDNPGQHGIFVRNPQGSTPHLLDMYNGVNQEFTVTAGGACYANFFFQWPATTVYEDVPLTEGLNVLKLLSPRKQKHAPAGTPRRVLALPDILAQLPEIVKTEVSGEEGIDVMQLIPILVNAIKELDARLTILEP